MCAASYSFGSKWWTTRRVWQTGWLDFPGQKEVQADPATNDYAADIRNFTQMGDIQGPTLS
jgi:hypothetical protein